MRIWASGAGDKFEVIFDMTVKGIDMHRRDACRIRPGFEGESSL